ncbi:MAG: glutamate--tRNA ligase [Clostridia bacterium]|nr:glutamate--tRNA ligase [Clostridia bacterium]
MSDYNDLANKIFPDAKERKFYEEKYPERDLKEGTVVTRFAPSPTGTMHIGNLFGATIDNKVAKQSGGVFYLRIEDTDQKREIEDGINKIIKALKDFDVIADEGMISDTESIGNYGPYKQSERKDIYQAFAKSLIAKGRAYPCFATEDELNEMRTKQETAKIRPGYYGVWAKYRKLTVEDAIKKIDNGEKYVIRFKSMGDENKKIKHHDVIKGNIEFPENDQDIIIIKSDGLPTYHFAHAVDDYLMKTTLVVRGEEWVSSIPLHLDLFKALEVKPPKYAHTATLLKSDNGTKRKISKRKDPEAAVSYYHEQGIPAEAVTEYLLNIANSNFEGWRKGNKDASIDEFKFDIKKMGVSGALFDIVKLLDISKTVISKYSAERIYEESLKWANRYDEELVKLLNNKEYSLEVLGIERGNAKPRKDIAKWSDVRENIEYMYDEVFFEKERNYEFGKINNKEEIKNIVKLYMEKYYDENDDKQKWFDKMKDLTESLGYAREVKDFKQNPEKWKAHVGDISTVLRVALTTRQNTPDLYEIMKVLGKDSMKKRFSYIEEQ